MHTTLLTPSTTSQVSIGLSMSFSNLVCMKAKASATRATHKSNFILVDFTRDAHKIRQRLYFATGYGLIQCVKGLMSFEDKVRFCTPLAPWQLRRSTCRVHSPLSQHQWDRMDCNHDTCRETR